MRWFVEVSPSATTAPTRGIASKQQWQAALQEATPASGGQRSALQVLDRAARRRLPSGRPETEAPLPRSEGAARRGAQCRVNPLRCAPRHRTVRARVSPGGGFGARAKRRHRRSWARLRFAAPRAVCGRPFERLVSKRASCRQPREAVYERRGRWRGRVGISASACPERATAKSLASQSPPTRSGGAAASAEESRPRRGDSQQLTQTSRLPLRLLRACCAAPRRADAEAPKYREVVYVARRALAAAASKRCWVRAFEIYVESSRSIPDKNFVQLAVFDHRFDSRPSGRRWVRWPGKTGAGTPSSPFHCSMAPRWRARRRPRHPSSQFLSSRSLARRRPRPTPCPSPRRRRLRSHRPQRVPPSHCRPRHRLRSWLPRLR